MKRLIAFLCALLLMASLLAACGKETENPGEEKDSSTQTTKGEDAAKLMLYTDTRPLRIVTQQAGVTVTLQKLEMEPNLGFLRPVADEWEETLEPGKEYEIDKELAETIPQYQLLVRQGKHMAIHYLADDLKDGKEIFEIEPKPWEPRPIEEYSPMADLCAAAATAIFETWDGYWYTIANAITTQRSVYQEMPPDGRVDGDAYYVIPEWLFEAYAKALFPDKEIPPAEEMDENWVSYYPDRKEYWVYLAYSTFLGADYKSAAKNPDGTWDLAVRLFAEGEEADPYIFTVAPNKAYNPDSPFEYHIVGMPEEGPQPAPPPPSWATGTWWLSLDNGRTGYIEIYEDGIAGLYIGPGGSEELYEIYWGFVSPDGNGDETAEAGMPLDMQISFEWERSIAGSPVRNPQKEYKGVYTVRHAWEDDQQVLHISTKSGDNLFGKKTLKVLWVPLIKNEDIMEDNGAMG